MTDRRALGERLLTFATRLRQAQTHGISTLAANSADAMELAAAVLREESDPPAPLKGKCPNCEHDAMESVTDIARCGFCGHESYEVLAERTETPALPTSSFNVNDYVCVRLQDRGLQAIAADPLKAAVHFHRKARDGWTEWQLWDLMSTLGHLSFMGPPPPFHTIIHIGRLDSLPSPPAGDE